MIQSFQRDSLLCKCGEVMTYLESYNSFKGRKHNNLQSKENVYMKQNISNQKHEQPMVTRI